MIPEPKLQGLYQEVILDHNRRPRNFREVPDATQYSHGVNPLCGDDYHLYLKMDADGIVQDLGFVGAGCAISKSSASIMTTLVKGKAMEEVQQLADNFLALMTQDRVGDTLRKSVDRMSIFEGVKEFPVRVKCATLIWHALQDALKDAEQGGKTSFKGVKTTMDDHDLHISVQVTPNPNSLQFLVSRELVDEGTYNFSTPDSAKHSKLAAELFGQGVAGVLIGKNFITVTKKAEDEWPPLVPKVVDTFKAFLASGREIVEPSAAAETFGPGAGSEIDQKIKQIIDDEIRPAVARDGGDIVFDSYDNGVVRLLLRGACSSCPSSIMTLKMGIENRLKQVIPEIREVISI
ncbi:MAG TPA: SUF system NifU family Fe-S cluster assembly protein [Verrucomicrobiae bacterium]|jgi:SUF system NifU family Fe-S assembly protein|nr:SUF system NifU family Fe-S cluster assembly protein [Verrucomicrobiae bacterium]